MNCCVPPTRMLTADGATVIDVSWTGGAGTVSVAVHSADPVRKRVLPSLNVPSAVNWTASPAARLAVTGLTARETSVAVGSVSSPVATTARAARGGAGTRLGYGE